MSVVYILRVYITNMTLYAEIVQLLIK